MTQSPSANGELQPSVTLCAGAGYALLTLAAAGGLFVDFGPDSAPGAAAFWMNRAYGWWAAITFVILQVGVGRVLLGVPRLRDCRQDGLLGWLVCATVGSFAGYCLLTALSLAGVLGGLGMPLYLIALGLAGVRGIVLIRRDVSSRPARGRPAEGPAGLPWLPWLVGALAIVWAVPYLVQTLLPNTDWDGVMYHLPLAARLLDKPLWAAEPTFPGFNFPAAINLFYAVFLRLRAESGVIPLNFLVSCGVALAAYALAARLWGKATGLWAAAICLATNIIWELGLDPRIDGFLAFYCTMAAGGVLLWVRRPGQPGLLILAGMATGAALGTKYTALLLGPMGLAAAALAAVRIVRRVPGTATCLALAGAAVLLPSGVWYARNAARLANAVYPYGRGLVFHDDRARPVPFRPAFEALTGRALSPGQMQGLTRQTILGVDLTIEPDPDRGGSLLRIWDVILRPSRHARKPYHWICPLLLVFLVLPAARRDTAALWLYGATLVTSLAAVIVLSHLTRYIVFVMPLMAVGAGAVLARVPWRPAGAAIALAVFAQVAWNAAAEYKKIAGLHSGAVLAGRASQLEWLSEVGWNEANSMPALTAAINRKIRRGALGDDATFFMIGESKGRHLRCRFVPDGSREGYPWLVELIQAEGDLDRLARSFRDRRIGYIIVCPRYFRWCLRYGSVRRDELAFSLHMLGRFLRRHARPIMRTGDLGVFQLAGSSGPRPARP